VATDVKTLMDRDASPSASPVTADVRSLQEAGDEVFRRLVESVRDYAIFLLSPRGTIVTWNVGAQRIKGYTASEVIGKHFSIFYTPEALATGWPEEELRRSAKDGRFEDEGWRVRKDGSRFWANVVISPIFGGAGRLIGFSKITRDLTERRRHEEELRERERNLRLLIDGVRDHAMFLLDRRGRIRTWNVGAQRMLGYTAEDAIGRDIRSLYTPQDQTSGRATAELAAARRSVSLHVEGWRSKADGTQIWVEVATTALFDDAHRVQGFVQIVRDLSERLRAEALESEGRRISQFIALLSHELRNPLAPIQNAVAVLGKAGVRPDLKWCAEVISRQAAHMKRLVDDLLDVSRVTSGKIGIEKKPVDLRSVITMAVDALRGTAAERGHTITTHLARAPLIVMGDPTRLHQVMTNLLMNSLKFTPPQGRIDVSAEWRDEIAHVQVTDTGIGMSASLLRHVFEPFVQGPEALDRPEGGLGIGLTLVKSIVELHGGTVTASSGGSDQGSTISLTLPLCDTHSTADDSSSPAQRVHAATSILIVDDNQDAADSLAMMLRLEGHDVRVANDGPQALALVQEMQPAVVVLDIGLPNMSGYEVARRLKSMPLKTNVRLIALTGYGQDDDLRAAFDAGFEQHLTKPVDPAELLRAIG
jgi:PAS domain S-box-containing protein